MTTLVLHDHRDGEPVLVNWGNVTYALEYFDGSDDGSIRRTFSSTQICFIDGNETLYVNETLEQIVELLYFAGGSPTFLRNSLENSRANARVNRKIAAAKGEAQ